MKITDVQTILVETGAMIKWVFVKVLTDEGITGISEVGNAGSERAQAAAIEQLKPRFVGQDPSNIKNLWTSIYKRSIDVRMPGSLHVSALGAIEMALWDIAGKKLNSPIYNLLGGKCRDSVRAYLHVQPRTEVEPGPEVYARMARERVEEGFGTLKFDPFWGVAATDATITPAGLRRIEQVVGAVREAVGDDVEIGIEFHSKFNTYTAIKIARMLEQFNPFFIEEPVSCEDIDALAAVASALDTPIASGERFCTKYAYREMLNKHAVDMVQIDTGRAGGFLESRTIADMADMCYMPILVHQPYGPVCDAIAVQLAAMIPNFLALEWPKYYYPVEPTDLRFRLVKEPLKVEKGYVQVPTAPGLGIELNEKELAKFVIK